MPYFLWLSALYRLNCNTGLHLTSSAKLSSALRFDCEEKRKIREEEGVNVLYPIGLYLAPQLVIGTVSMSAACYLGMRPICGSPLSETSRQTTSTSTLHYGR